MKILLISASPRKRKSQTFLLAKQVLKSCSNKSVECETLHLCDLKMDYCHACDSCHREIMRCRIKDDVRAILEKMLEADGLILASPNYINQVTASMKTLFERSGHFIHCKRLLGKYAVGVVSSGSGRDEGVLDYMKHYAHMCGAQFSGGVSSRAPVGTAKLREAAGLGKRLFSDIKTNKPYGDQIRAIDEGRKFFGRIILDRRHEWPDEYRYWRDKGWL